MDLESLYYSIREIGETAVIGRDFSAYGMEYSLVGLINIRDNTELVLLEFDESKEYNDCEPKNPTNRDIALSDKYTKKGLGDLISKISINGECFTADLSHGSSLDVSLDEDLYILAEFMKKGWKPKKFFSYPTECIFVHFICLDKTVSNLSRLDLSQPIGIKAYETFVEEFPEIKIELPIEKDINKTVSLFGGQEEICIKRVTLYNPNDNCNLPLNEINPAICSDEMRIPVVEYTCSNESLSIDINMSSYLNRLFYDDCDDVAFPNGVLFIQPNIILDNENKDRNFITIQQAVDKNATQIECEIIRCSKETEKPDIKEFYI